jgi:AmmeMemoRadiSam system protein B
MRDYLDHDVNLVARTRPAAVAGAFYPARPSELAASVDRMLGEARPAEGPAPKALVVPHAGYVYSGPIAASAYATWRGVTGRIVLFGPAHHVGLRGLALPDATQLETPLGRVSVDAGAVRKVLGLPQVSVSERVHAREHSLEVQLPFLQRVLKDFTVVPLAVGDATREELAEVIDLLWEGAHLLISTDLSHYLPWKEATALDRQTADAVVAMDPGAIADDQACGNVALRGFLDVAKRRGLQGQLLDLRTSGDTAGDKDRVVGYGAFAFYAGGAR